MIRIITLNFQKFFFNDWNEWNTCFVMSSDHATAAQTMCEFQNSAHQLTLQACTQLPQSNSSICSEQHFVNLTEIYYSVLVLRGVI